MIDSINFLYTLKTAGANVTEIAWICGYADVIEFQDYFNELYHNIPEIYLLNPPENFKISKEDREYCRKLITRVREEMQGDRPKDVLIVSRVTELAQSLTPKDSILAILGLSEADITESLQRERGMTFDEFLKIRSEVTKSQLRKEQIKGAKKGNQVLLVHLGEHLLSQSKKSDPMQVNVSLSKLIEEAHKQIESHPKPNLLSPPNPFTGNP